MNILNAFDSDLLCELFSESTLFIALCTSKALTKSLAPLIEKILTQQALAIAMREDVFEFILSVANKAMPRQDNFRVGECVCHGMNFRTARTIWRFRMVSHISVHTSRPLRTMSVCVSLNVYDQFQQFAGINYIKITPISEDRGTLTIDFSYCDRLRDIFEVEVGYHRGYVAALGVFGVFV